MYREPTKYRDYLKEHKEKNFIQVHAHTKAENTNFNIFVLQFLLCISDKQTNPIISIFRGPPNEHSSLVAFRTVVSEKKCKMSKFMDDDAGRQVMIIPCVTILST